jgi:hypothetical protein
VAWIGGSHVNVSISVGGGHSAPPVGWFPLAPREVYVPAYRHSPVYVRNINVTHVTNVTQITTIVNNTNGAADRRDFANRKFPNAVTVVPASVVTSRAPVAAEAARVRSDPQVRALVADPRPVKVTAVAPVEAPPAAAKPPSGKVAVSRPPLEGRAPGSVAARPGTRQSEVRRRPSPARRLRRAPQAGLRLRQGHAAAAPCRLPAGSAARDAAGRRCAAGRACAGSWHDSDSSGCARDGRPARGRAGCGSPRRSARWRESRRRSGQRRAPAAECRAPGDR